MNGPHDHHVELETYFAMRRALTIGRPRFDGLIDILWTTGARIGEIAQLRRRDFEFERPEAPLVNFRATVTKTGKQRHVPITAIAALRLATIFRQRRDFDYLWSNPNRLSETWPAGQGVDVRTLSTWIKFAAVKAGQPGISAHSFRHAYATRLLRVTNMRVVQQLLGHAAISSTQIYTHPTLDDLRLAVTEAFEKEASL